MTTAALSSTGDFSEVFSKQAPAQRKILLIDNQWDTSLFIVLQREGYEVIAVDLPKRHGVWFGRYDLTSSLFISPT